MNFYEYYYENIVKYDLLNKFQYKDVNQIPRFNKIILNFGCKKSELRFLGPTLMALELITSQKSILTSSNVSNISLKIKKGSPVGCKVTLRKTLMYMFLVKLINAVFPKLKQFYGFRCSNIRSSVKTISFKLKNNLVFSELENHYQYFNKLPYLNITIITNTSSFNELLFLLKSFKFPIQK
jgi:large subunit ribosomal protein L5